MEFKARISYKFAIPIIVTAFAFALVFYIFISTDDVPGSGSSFDLLILLVIGLRLLYLSRNIDVLFSKNPVLVINEDYIYDAVKKVKFGRDEIEELYEDNGYLYLKLKPQIEGSGDDYESVRSHKINLEIVDIKPPQLSEIIFTFNKPMQFNKTGTGSASEISFRFKWGRKNLWLIFLQLLWLTSAILYATGPYKDYYLAVYLLVFVIAVALHLAKFFHFWIKNKPVLTANRSFIYDQVNNIKYYWSDIDEVVVNNDFMRVKLYHPEKYIDEVKNPVQRFFKKILYDRFHKKPSYSINMDIVCVDAEDYNKFLNTLNEFSITGT